MLASFVPVLPAAAIPVPPKTIYVDAVNGDDVTGDGTADNPYMSITTGLGDAGYGDTIDIAPGTYSPEDTGEVLPLPVTTSKITLRGSDQYECVIDGEWSNTIIWMMDASEFTISGLTLTHGYAESGGAVVVGPASTLTMTDCVLTQNFAGSGGAIFTSDSTVILTNCEFTENGNSAWNVVPVVNSQAFIDACHSSGAIMSFASVLSIDGCTFGDNSASETAGAIGAEGSTIDVVDSSFYGNALSEMMMPSSALDLKSSGLVPTGGLPFGGAMIVVSSELSVVDSTFSGNMALLGSSLIGIDASMQVTGSWFAGDMTMAGVVANIGDFMSGASADALGELAPTEIIFEPSLTVEGCTFEFNEGSPIAVQALPALIRNCVVANNGSDPATLIFIESDADVVNTTLAGNISNDVSIYSQAGVEPQVVAPSLPEVRVANSIVWDVNGAEVSVVGARVEYSDLMYRDEVTPTAFDESVISEDPEFVGAEDGDYSLAASSPCIDSGFEFEVAPDSDIDGTPRPLDGDVSGIAEWDMGAYEFGSLTDGRIEGTDRYETGVAISQDSFASAETAVLATGRIFADGLAAAGLAGAYNAPVLLTQPRTLPASVAAELLRLGVSRVIVCGDQRAISDSVIAQIEALGDIEIQRIGGSDRYETASMVADEIVDVTGEDPALVFVARGDTFPDALAVSPIAWAHRAPILLVRPEELPRYTVDFLFGLTGTTKGVIVGGSAAVSLGVQGELSALGGPTFDRISGDDRYDTAAEVAYWAEDSRLAGFGVTGVATGEDFADALCAGPGVGAHGGVLLLTPKHTAALSALAAIGVNGPEITALQIFGSSVAIDDDVAEDLESARRDR